MGRRLRRFRKKMKEKVAKLMEGNATERVFEAVGDDKPPILSADIVMISGCEDKQTSADVSNVS